MLPSHKGDDEAFERLQALSRAEQIQVARDLLNCMRDGNWPIFLPSHKILLTIVHDIGNDLLRVLQSDDATWKRNVIINLLEEVPTAITPCLQQELVRIATYPTWAEKEEDAQEAAQQILHLLRD